MEKLLNLLQEFYWENRKFSNDDWLLTMTNWVENLSGAYAQTYIISLKGGFIKWLVENDKIRKDIYRPIPLRIKATYEDGVVYHDKLEDRIIMLLSISDTPIEDLISYLK
jgi:hypothetical protein